MFSAAGLYGTQPQVPSVGLQAVTEPMAINIGATGMGSLVDPHNPIFWFGAFLLATVGLAGLSGSARVGKAKVSAAVGK